MILPSAIAGAPAATTTTPRALRRKSRREEERRDDMVGTNLVRDGAQGRRAGTCAQDRVAMHWTEGPNICRNIFAWCMSGIIGSRGHHDDTHVRPDISETSGNLSGVSING